MLAQKSMQLIIAAPIIKHSGKGLFVAHESQPVLPLIFQLGKLSVVIL